MTTIPSVDVTKVATTAAGANVNGYIYQIEYTSLSNSGIQKVLKVNYTGCRRAGCRPVYTGLTSSDNGIGVTTSDVTTLVKCPGRTSCYKEAIECGEHGICDRKTGLCKCFPMFYGDACNVRYIPE